MPSEEYKDDQCVGCDANTQGTYRDEYNWHLCNECYEQTLEFREEN